MPKKLTPSIIALIAANLVPLFGVLFLDWNLSSIIFLYWFENIVIGFYTVTRILKAKKPIKNGVRSGNKQDKSKKGLITFFIFHYGFFTLGHGAFLFTTLATDFIFTIGLVVPILSMFISHGYSYLNNFVGQKEYLHVSPDDLFLRPYGRIAIIHLTVMAGGFLTSFLGQPFGMLLVLIGLKTLADLISHISEHSTLIKDIENKVNIPSEIHLSKPVADRLLTIPGFKEQAENSFRAAVESGKWEEIKKDMDPETVKKVETYYKTNSEKEGAS